ncbi:tudor domain-containing protein 10 isoform X4 [Bubalus bubalis]|uniref:tudor domain-containing protein 10 isoform X4 n=1 Tax=Bubalus bubalis TaxID=89462 RepID=UPI001E1B997A|nr:tudor domain-containing protein 10 isoform X4 [Bubalus bubalis]
MGVLPLPKELEVRRGYSLHCLCKHILGMCVGECLLKAGEEAVGTGPGAAAATVPGRTAGSAPRAPSSSRPTGAAAAVGDWLRTSGPARAPRASEEAELLEEEARRLGVWAAGWTHLARERSWSSSDFRTSAKVFGENGTLEEQKSPKFKKRETEVYVGNLPLDISEEEIRCLLKDFSPLHVHRVQNGCRCFAFVDLGSMQKVALAIQALNGKLFHKRKLYVNSNNRSPKRTPDVTERPQELLVNRRQWQPTPVLAPGKSHGWRSLISEKASAQGFAGTTACPQLTPKASGEPCETEKSKTSFFAVPMEMRGSFLVLLLRECFRDLGWLATIPSISGEVGLLVTSTVPQTPFFWAMHITETLQQNMQALFSALAEAEEQQPYLHDSAVRRGTRGLAEYHLGDYGPAWNRCWVLDRVDSWVVVMFVDFGRSATIPVQSLRTLDSDDFWTIPPLTQPFMLEKAGIPSLLLT